MFTFEKLEKLLESTKERQETTFPQPIEHEDDLDDSVDTLDPEDSEEPTVEGRDESVRKYNEFFASYRRPKDVSSKLQKDADYDLKALIKRRTKSVPDDVPFGMSDLFSEKEIDAIMKHPKYDSLDRIIRDNFLNALEEQIEDIATSIDDVLINAFLSETKVLERGLPAEAVYRAGMATHSEGVFRLSELGERHAKDLLDERMSGEEVVIFGEDLSENKQLENTPEMTAELEKIAKSGARISIRPNLSSKTKEILTVHKGSVGTKLAHVRVCTIKCTGTVVQESGRKKVAQGGHKNVHAGLIGTVHDEVIMPKPGDPLVKYNPRRDEYFHINGKRYDGGGLVTMVGWVAYKVK